MFSNQSILSAAGINFSRFGNTLEIFCSKGNQLFGSYAGLGSFRSSYRVGTGPPPYAGWEVHHIVEDQDLGRLGIAQQFPPYQQQLCVLLPRSAHIGRINNILRNRNPTRYSATAKELLSAYKEAYELVGDYSGGGERLIRQELVAIVSAVFRLGNAG
jgi:hypothetical protein